MADDRGPVLGVSCRYCGNIIAMAPVEMRTDQISLPCDQCGRRALYAFTEAFSLPLSARKQKTAEGDVGFGRRRRQ
jgi:hypothetical protein